MQPYSRSLIQSRPRSQSSRSCRRILLCIFWLHKSFPNLTRQNERIWSFQCFPSTTQNMLSARRYFSFNFVTLDDLRHADDLPIDLKAQNYDKLNFCVLWICSSLIHLFNWLWWFRYSFYFSHFLTLYVMRCCHIEEFIIFSHFADILLLHYKTFTRHWRHSREVIPRLHLSSDWLWQDLTTTKNNISFTTWYMSR